MTTMLLTTLPARPTNSAIDTTPPSAEPLEYLSRASESADPAFWDSLPVPTEYTMGRSNEDRQALRQHAADLIKHRDDVQLDEDETTGNNSARWKLGIDVAGAVIDKKSEPGLVSITAPNKTSRTIKTGPGADGAQFEEVVIESDETCMIYGRSSLIYLTRRPQQ